MPRDPLIGLVGKPSSGKSTTLNSLTDATSKVGNFPFTTIDPNRAIGYLRVPCACARFGLEARCAPNYGSCLAGQRSVPIELLDVAGLVPGAHEGKGLGNRFLDDLRKADGLVHVVDVSGTTDAEGKETRGYDPSKDIQWLRSEIVSWIRGNLMEKWGSIKRRHMAIKATAVETLQAQFSGYGSTAQVVAKCLDHSGVKEPLEHWSDETIEKVVNAFTDVKFPTVIALNKIDHPDADKNIAKIAKQHPPESLVLTSAISEVFLRKLAKQKYIRYVEGTDQIQTLEDLLADAGGDSDEARAARAAAAEELKEMDEKLKNRLENLRDLVIYRFGSTGVVQVLSRAGELLGLVPVFPVRNVSNFGAGSGGGLGVAAAAAGTGAGHATAGGGDLRVFRDCVLVKRGATVGDVFRKVMGEVPLAYVETAGGVRVSEDDVIVTGKNDILSFKVGRA